MNETITSDWGVWLGATKKKITYIHCNMFQGMWKKRCCIRTSMPAFWNTLKTVLSKTRVSRWRPDRGCVKVVVARQIGVPGPHTLAPHRLWLTCEHKPRACLLHETSSGEQMPMTSSDWLTRNGCRRFFFSPTCWKGEKKAGGDLGWLILPSLRLPPFKASEVDKPSVSLVGIFCWCLFEWRSDWRGSCLQLRVPSRMQNSWALEGKQRKRGRVWAVVEFFIYLFIFPSLAGGTEGRGGGFTADSREQEKQERKLEGFYVK